VSATLAASEALARGREAGQPVLPLAFGRPGFPSTHSCGKRWPQPPGATPAPRWPGCPGLREAAGYWPSRGPPTSAGAVVTTALSKSLSLGGWLMAATRCDSKALPPGEPSTEAGQVAARWAHSFWAFSNSATARGPLRRRCSVNRFRSG
jgi:hypothetical protein